jgi:alkylation response protein AidB-like acyl-CoA dehydrogenase
LSEEGRKAVFANGPVAVWGALQPKGTSEPVDGGYLVSGAWGWGSGSAQARFVEVQTMFQVESGAPWMRVHVIEKDKVQIDEGSWNVLGLRATTSINYKIENVFVPKHMTFEYPLSSEMFLTRKLVAGKEVDAGDRAQGALRAVDHAAVGLAGLCGWAAGVAGRALDELTNKASNIYRLTGAGSQADDPLLQLGLAEHDGRLRVARTTMLSLLQLADRLQSEGAEVDAQLRVDIFQAGLTLTRAAREAVIFAYDNSGSSVIHMSNPIQRCLRDIFTGLKHAAASSGVFLRVGKARLGLEGVGL